MNLTDLVDSLHATHAPGGPDLDRIRRQGRRIRVRRRAGAAAAIAVAAALIGTPFALGSGGEDRHSTTISPADTPEPDAREIQFETTAPMGAPVGAVSEPGMKFYVATDGLRSVGSLALWAEGDGDRLAYGARLIDKDGSLRRAGTMAVPVLGTGIDLIRVPGQNREEPTFVGLLPAPPAPATVATSGLHVVAKDTYLRTGIDPDVVPGYLLVWVSASTGSEPGIDLRGFTVRTVAGEVIARGGFAPAKE